MPKLCKLTMVAVVFTNLACGAKPKEPARPAPAPVAPKAEPDNTADKLIEKCSVKFMKNQLPEEILLTADSIRRNCNYDEGQVQLMAERLFKD